MSAIASTAAEKSTFQDRVEELFFSLLMTAVGILGVGALVYYGWNWGVVGAFTFLNPLSGFWMGPMLVAGAYFVVVAAKMVLSDSLSLSLDDFDDLVDKVAPLAGLLLLFYLVHHYLT